MADSRPSAKTFVLDLRDEGGRNYRGRITVWKVAESDEFGDVYLTEDDRVVFHKSNELKLVIVDGPEAPPRGVLAPGTASHATEALMSDGVIDI